MQIPSYPVYRWFFIHCLCDSLGAAVLRPVASLCQCNCAQLLVVFLACSGGSQTLAFRKKTVYPWLSRFACWKPAVANLFYRYTRVARFTVSNRPSSWLSVDFYYISQIESLISFVGKLGVYITYMKMGSTTISFLLLPDESRRIRFVTSIAGLFSPHLF